MNGRLLIHGAAELLSCASGAADGIGRVPGGDVLIEDGRIVDAGRLGEVTAETRIDAAGRVVMPGFVDCHTHVVFGGSRVDEYVANCAGRSVREGAPRGIVGTMRETRALGPRELADASAPRVRQMLRHGTTTVESKSGYGLSPEAELAMLEANRLLAAETGMRIVSTYLGAHAIPPDVDRDAYVAGVCEAIPEIADSGLAAFCDAYCDEGFFTPAETRRILSAGADHGLAPKLHLDAYGWTGAATIASELRATTVDHLNHTSPEELELLAEAGVTGVVMPVLDFAVQHARPTHAATLVRHGLRIALATDCCPGCHVESMQVVIQHACRTGGLTPAAAIRAATIDAARAAGCAAVTGSLEPGKDADVLILDTDRHEDVAYRLGRNAVRTVLRGGEVVV